MIIRTKTLRFSPENAHDEKEGRYIAHTPFGTYGYKRIASDRIIAWYAFGEGHCDDLVICGNAMTAQRACNHDFTSRVKQALGINESALAEEEA